MKRIQIEPDSGCRKIDHGRVKPIRAGPVHRASARCKQIGKLRSRTAVVAKPNNEPSRHVAERPQRTDRHDDCTLRFSSECNPRFEKNVRTGLSGRNSFTVRVIGKLQVATQVGKVVGRKDRDNRFRFRESRVENLPKASPKPGQLSMFGEEAT